METSHAPKDDEEETPAKRRFTQCSTIVGAIVGIVMLIVSIIAYAQLAGFVNDYTSISNSWTTNPVGSISFTTGSCGAGEEEIYNEWPGLNDACDCTNKRQDTNSTSSDTVACGSQQLSDGCQSRLSTYPNPIRLQPFQGLRMCVGRVTPDALTRSQDVNNCNPSTEKVCGSLFCWPTSQPCPITDFILDTVVVSQSAAEADDAPVSVGLTGYTLYVKRGGRLSSSQWPDGARVVGGAGYLPTGLPITVVSFQPALPCTLDGCGYGGRSSEYSSMQNNYKTAHPTEGYSLKSFRCSGGCRKPDVSNSVSPDGLDLRYLRSRRSVTEAALYASALVPIEFRTTDLSYEWYLQWRSEILWNAGCPEARNKVVDRKNDVQSVRNAQTALLIFGIISFLVLTLYFPCIVAFGSPETKKKTKNANLACNVCIKLATLICTIVTVVVAYSTLSFWSSINDYKLNNAAGCADPLSNETFKVLGDKFGELSYKNAITTAASGATGLVDIIVAILKR